MQKGSDNAVTWIYQFMLSDTMTESNTVSVESVVNILLKNK